MSFNPLLFFSLFARLSGLFLLSPLFASRHIPVALRGGLTFVTSLLLFFPLQEHASFAFTPSLFALNIIKEIAIGYLIGFVFAFLIESALLGAKMITTLAGFSATELVNPNVSFGAPVLNRLFVLLVIALLLTLDLHHFFFQIVSDSITFIPIGPYPFTALTTQSIIKGTSLIFHHALDYAFIPFVALSLLTVFFALFSRLFPNVPVFFISPPLQIIVSLLVLSLAIKSFPLIFQNNFTQIKELISEILDTLIAQKSLL